MAQQESEDCTVPKSSRNGVLTEEAERTRGGKAVPVNEQTRQLEMPFATAESPNGVTGRAGEDRSSPARCEVPKAKRKTKQVVSATMEEVTAGLRKAFVKVASNKGAPGPDGQSVDWVREHLDWLIPKLEADLLAGRYQPGMIRRVYIPKAGGHRGLGIPNVVDRMVAEAVRRVLEPLYEPTFHPSSHGFRPKRSCHTAIAEARQHIEEGYDIVVDTDVERFFDLVCHQRLLARLAQRVQDRRILVLIGRMLKAKVVMPEGVVVNTEEGVPQGGPLSPLLSNIVLDELDWELERRGHRFVRYADDCNVYVRSERAGQRVMAGMKAFMERRLRLQVNAKKSAVARPEDRHFLGFRLRREPLDGDVEVLLSERSQERIRQRIRELTPRNWGNSMHACIVQVNAYFQGWLGFFGVCTAGIERTLHVLDAHTRRRLRAIQLKHWKRKRTIARKLIALGVQRKTAWRRVYAGRKSLWALSHDYVAERGLRNAYFAERGLVSLVGRWQARQRTIIVPEQLCLFLG